MNDVFLFRVAAFVNCLGYDISKFLMNKSVFLILIYPFPFNNNHLHLRRAVTRLLSYHNSKLELFVFSFSTLLFSLIHVRNNDIWVCVNVVFTCRIRKTFRMILYKYSRDTGYMRFCYIKYETEPYVTLNTNKILY